jgi:hypothetical protein
MGKGQKGDPGGTMNSKTGCPLCDDVLAEETVDSGANTLFLCRRCGRFNTTGEFETDVRLDGLERKFLSAATRQASDSFHPITLTTKNWKAYIDQQRSVRMSERIVNLLTLIARMSERPGRGCTLDLDYHASAVGALDKDELQFYIDDLTRKQLAWETTRKANTRELTLSPAGWAAVEPIITQGGTPGRCFIAMSFASDLDDAYAQIEAAVRSCNHTPVRMDRLHHNDDISDRMLAEIRGAEYMVADFTNRSRGVYYEAGFARGLGRQVICSCKEGPDFEDLHFDTDHLNYIKWAQADDLREKLVNRIKATILPKT